MKKAWPSIFYLCAIVTAFFDVESAQFIALIGIGVAISEKGGEE